MLQVHKRYILEQVGEGEPVMERTAGRGIAEARLLVEIAARDTVQTAKVVGYQWISTERGGSNDVLHVWKMKSSKHLAEGLVGS
jgi:hypothetical protein